MSHEHIPITVKVNIMADKTKVFISYKYHGSNCEVLPDYYMAKELYEELESANISTFFSDATIMHLGLSDYKRVIDKHLDEAELLVVVSTTPENCEANWVRYEWDSFYNDLLSDRKKGELVSYLDTDNIGAFPRTIRTLQVFEKKDNGLENIVKFIKQYFEVANVHSAENISNSGSSYNYNHSYELGDERKRLAIQAHIESSEDYSNISELLNDDEKIYTILDVGCSTGTVTFDLFGKFGNRVRVLGVDKFESCVTEFNESAKYDNMYAEKLDFDRDDWDFALEKYMDKYNIQKFDLIYCSLSLHHMSNSENVVKKLWKYISYDGYIYVRTCDDALKLAYPDGEPIYDIIQMTANVPHASDRYHGRKIYAILYKAKFKNIQMKSFLIDTGNKDMDERYALFYSAFVWRKNYFENMLDIASTPNDMDVALQGYNKVIGLLNKIENLFMDKSFYFGYYVTIAIAQKKQFFSCIG